MFFLNKHVLTLTALYLAVIPQKTMSNLKCFSECGNAKNTLNYSFCYTNEKFTLWEYCIPNAKGSNDNKISISQTGFINVDSTRQNKGETFLTSDQGRKILFVFSLQEIIFLRNCIRTTSC